MYIILLIAVESRKEYVKKWQGKNGIKKQSVYTQYFETVSQYSRCLLVRFDQSDSREDSHEENNDLNTKHDI